MGLTNDFGETVFIASRIFLSILSIHFAPDLNGGY
jgi:hypothetical protein